MPTIAYDPVPFGCSPAASSLDVIRLFLGHYRSRLFLTDHSYIDVGRGSLTAGLCVHSDPDHVGSLGTIGEFCEPAQGVTIMSNGAHRNDNPINCGFGEVGVIRRMIGKADMMHEHLAPSLPIKIGNNVLLSHGTTVLPGCSIADGCAVGAASLVTKSTEPFGIYGGVPARLLSQRPNAETIARTRWWDWSLPYFLNNAHRLQELAVSDGPHDYAEARPRFAFRRKPSGLDLIGFIADDCVQPLTSAPQKVQDYIRQIGPGQGRYWLADVWWS